MNNLKQQSQEWYETEVKSQNKYIVDIANVQQWQTEVMESTVPIVLDCYADWCEPCKKLTPILEKRAQEGQGKWKLVKLNIDKNGQIAHELKIKSVPTVFLISNGNAVDGFTGIPDQKKLEQFFETINKVIGISNDANEVVQKFSDLIDLIISQENFDQNKIQESINQLSKIDIVKQKYASQFLGIKILFNSRLGNKQAVQLLRGELETKYATELQSPDLQQLLQFSQNVLEQVLQQKSSSKHPFIEESLENIEKDPKNLQLRYNLAEYYANNKFSEEAIETCLEIIKIDRNWEEKKANKLLIKIFEELGSTNPLVIKARKQLSKILF